MEVPDPPEDRATFEGLSDAVRPLDETVAVNATVPVKPPRLARLRVEVAVEPDAKMTAVGLAVRP